MKALIVTPWRSSYDKFISHNKLNPRDYPCIREPEQIHGYRDTIAIVLPDRWRIEEIEDIKQYCDTHSIDTLEV